MTVSKAQKATDEHAYDLVRLYQAKRPDASDSYPVAVGEAARDLHVSVYTIKARVQRHLASIPWTRFMDMHSGGGLKEGTFNRIYIQAPVEEAKIIFYNRFGHDPERVSCTCCGEDYSVGSYDADSVFQSLEQATSWDRGTAHDDDGNVREYADDSEYRIKSDKYITLTDYMLKDDVLFVNASQIKPSERVGTIPETGWVWQG